MSHPIYLDYNATTPLLPEVLDAMLPYLREHFGNPSSSHIYGTKAREAVDLARAQVAALLGCDATEITFTSGGTEANNLAIRGLHTDRRHIVTSSIEHPATERPCAWLEANGWRVTRLPVDANGVTQLEPIDESTALVTVMHSNNETGVLQPIAELATRAHAVGAIMHTDAAQSIGKVPVRVRELDVDLLSIAGHKLYAPKGIGALYIRKGVRLAPLVLGAGHERGLRPGTENVASIVGLGAACRAAARDLEAVAAALLANREALWRLLSAGVPDLKLNGDPERRLPNTLNVIFPGVGGRELLDAAPEVAASTGSACHDSHEGATNVRLTIGRGTTAEEIAKAAAALVAAWRSVRARRPD
jgi:cysteine desulfurase